MVFIDNPFSMGIVMAVLGDFLSFFNPRTKRGLVRFVVVAIVIVISFVVLNKETTTEEVAEAVLPTVEVRSAGSFSAAGNINLIGEVEAISQAEVKAEASGRVTQVRVEIGDAVGAGAVLATLENASERAALLQAEGAYEAALASAALSDVSVSSAQVALENAQDSAISAYRDAYTTVSSVLYNNIDTIYSDPDGHIPGVRIEGGSQTPYLNSTRVTLQDAMPAWLLQTTKITPESDLTSALTQASGNVSEILSLVDVIITRLNTDPQQYANTEFSGLRAQLIADRTVLSNTVTNLNNTKASLAQAVRSLTQAELGGTDSTLSSANAQVKQALGSLRAAEAAYNKTIITTPIAGVVNEVSVNAGDFVSTQAPIAIVANNNALEITTFVGESDRAELMVGQSVVIEGGYAGTITRIAPAVNPTTRKVEVKIQTETSAIANGDTVRISIPTETTTSENVDVQQKLMVPLTAVKFTETDGVVFTVEDNVLIAHPVEIGRVNGSFVEILSGIESSSVIVVDARGRAAGQKVEALKR